MIKNKKVFITGGAGFIANTIIRRLVNHNQIVVYDKQQANHKAPGSRKTDCLLCR